MLLLAVFIAIVLRWLGGDAVRRAEDVAAPAAEPGRARIVAGLDLGFRQPRSGSPALWGQHPRALRSRLEIRRGKLESARAPPRNLLD